MVRKSDMVLGVLVVLVLVILFSSTREGLETAQKITASVSSPYSDGKTIIMKYTYSPSKAPPPTRAMAAIRSIKYTDKSGKVVATTNPPNTDMNIPSSGTGDRKWIIDPPKEVDVSNLSKLEVTSYVYYVGNQSHQKTGEQSDDIVTSIPVSA